jgi:hypothetical protein
MRFSSTDVKSSKLDQSPSQQLQSRFDAVDFSISIACLSFIRYLSDFAPELPLSVANSLIVNNGMSTGQMLKLISTDMICQLVPLLTNPPWVKKEDGKLLKFTENQWQVGGDTYYIFTSIV